MKRLTALFAALAFVVGTTAFVAAQMPPAEKKAAPAATKPAEKTANGTVKSATADSVVVVGKDDKGKDVERTFSINDKTQIKKAGKDVMAKDLVAGDGVNVHYTDREGKSVASAINAVDKSPPSASPSTNEQKKDQGTRQEKK